MIPSDVDTRTVLLVGCILAAALGGTTATVAGADAGTNGTAQTRATLEVPTLDGPDTYAGNHTWLRLWSGDTDDPDRSAPIADGSWGFEASLAATTDASFRRPLDAPAEWNARNVRAYPDPSPNVSRYPAGVTPTDGPVVRDAFVAIYAIDPSTTLHRGNRTTRFVGERGRLHAISDFRIPTGRERGAGPIRETIADVTSTEIEVSLHADGRRLDRASGARTTLEFAGLAGTERLRAEAEIRAELRVETRRCTRWNDSTGACDGRWNVSHADRTATETVVTERTVRVNDVGAADSRLIAIDDGQPSIEELHAPSGAQNASRAGDTGATTARGERAVALQLSGHWSSIEVGPTASLGSHLRYYSRSPTGWRTMVVADAEGKQRTTSRIRPLKLHAYPGPDGRRSATGAADTDRITVRAVEGEARPGPTLGDAVDLSVPARYESIEELVVATAVSDPTDARSVTIHGIVPGRERTVTLPEPTVARPVEFGLALDSINETHTRLRARVDDAETGRSLSTGQVRVRGSRHEVTNGTAYTVLEDPPRRVEARYEPASWLSADRVHRPATDAVERPAPTPDVAGVIDLALWMALGFVPLSLAIYGLDRATNGRVLGITDTEP